LIENSARVFDIWAVQGSDVRLQRQKYYCEMLLRSKFSLCPRGSGPSSIRLFESMQLGVAPVIISDVWRPPRGPRFHEFSITIKEKHVGELERIVRSYESSYREMGALARTAFKDYFSDEVYFNYVVGECMDIMERQRLPEKLYWKLSPWIVRAQKAKWVWAGGGGRGLRKRGVARSVARVFLNQGDG
jgi:hypothetical protein